MKKYCILFVSFLVASFGFAQNSIALFPFPDEKGVWGYVDAQKNVKIAYQFLGASPFYEERAFIARQEAGKEKPTFSVINITGKILFDVNIDIQPPYQLCQMNDIRYSEGLLGLFSNDDNVPNKYIDREGKTVLTLPKGKYNLVELRPFFNGLTHVSLDSTYLYIDKTGKEILTGYSWGMAMNPDFSDGWAVANFGNFEKRDYQYINTKGEKAPFLKKDSLILDLSVLSEGVAFIAYLNSDDNMIYGLLKTDGTITPINAPMTYSSPSTTLLGYKFSNDLALVNINIDKPTSVYLNKQGKIAFRMPKILQPYTKKGYVPITGTNFHQGLACWIVYTSAETCKIVYINTKGQIVFESTNIKR